MNDAEEHELSEHCECKPKPLDNHSGGVIWVHSAFDGRHLIEEAERLNEIVQEDLPVRSDLSHLLDKLEYGRKVEQIWKKTLGEYKGLISDMQRVCNGLYRDLVVSTVIIIALIVIIIISLMT